MQRPLTSIITRIALLLVVVAGAGVAYAARNVEAQTTFATNGIDLLVDSKAFYNGAAYPKSTWSLKDLKPHADKFFKFTDVKPGDYGRTVISLHTKKDSAWMCLSFDGWEDKENGRNEPEKKADTSSNQNGELADGMEFFAWFDDGDNKFEVGEKVLFGTSTQSGVQTVKNKTYTLADYKKGPAWAKNSVHYVGIAWCAGNMSVNLSTAVIGCDGTTIGNEAQTDSLSFDVSIEAVPSKQNPKFTCAHNGYGSPHGGYDHPHDNDYSWYDWGDDDHGGACRYGRD